MADQHTAMQIVDDYLRLLDGIEYGVEEERLCTAIQKALAAERERTPMERAAPEMYKMLDKLARNRGDVREFRATYEDARALLARIDGDSDE